MWFSFFAALPEDEEIMPRQMEIVYAVFAQLEDAVEARRAEKLAAIPNLKSLAGRTLYVGTRAKTARRCRHRACARRAT